LGTGKIHRVFYGSMRRSLLLLILVVLLPVLALQTYLYVEHYYAAVADELKGDREFARAIGQAFQAYVRDVSRQEVAVGAGLASLRPYTAEQANHFLRTSVAQYASVMAFHWTTPEGRVIASSDPAAIGLNVADREYFQRALPEPMKWEVSDLLLDRASGRVAFVIAVDVRDFGGALEGVVLATIDPTKLGKRTLAIERPEGGRFTLFDRTGRLAYTRPEVEMAYEDRPFRSQDSLLDRALSTGQESSGRLVSPIDGQEVLAACVPLPEMGWVVSAGRPTWFTARSLEACCATSQSC
jgi:hypothetical protein